MKDQPKSKQPQSSSFQILLQAVEDPYIPAKLKVVKYVAGKLNKYLRGFQTDQSMVPLLNGTLLELLYSLMSMFINNATMKKATSSLKLLKIDTSDTNLYKQNAIKVGMGAKMHIRELKKQPNFKKSTLLKFYKETCGFLAAIISHMIEKSLINYQIVHLASCMDPVYIANENIVENCTLKYSKLVERITSEIGDDAKEHFMKMISEVVPKFKDKFLEFNKYEHLLETFFSQFLLEKCYESFPKVFVLTFCLFHGQAAIEHDFKTNNDCSVTNQSKESLIALRIAKDHLNAKTVTAANIPITRNMISNVKAAKARYFEKIEQKKKEENQREVNLNRKIVSKGKSMLPRKY